MYRPGIPGYSLSEVDYYAWIPASKRHDIPNHRLSLRKNLVTEDFEVYRAYTSQANAQILQNRKVVGHMVTFKESGVEEVAFKDKELQKALDFGNQEWDRMHGTDDYNREPDRLCTHGDSGTTATFCPVVRGLVDPEDPKPWGQGLGAWR